MQITKAVVPAGGRGTRLYPVTKAQPKEMLPLGGRPTIQGVAEELFLAGINDILIVTSEGKRAIEDHFDPMVGRDGSKVSPEDDSPLFDRSAVTFSYTRQGAPRGLGDAVACGRRFVDDEHFVVSLGDCLILSREPVAPLQRMIAAHTEHNAAASILMQRVSLEATSRYGIADPGDAAGDTAFVMRDIVEKPGPDAAPSRFAVAARYVFSPILFDYLSAQKPGLGAEIQLTDAIRAMIADGHTVLGVPLAPGERRLDVGNLESYARAFVRTMLTDADRGEGLRAYVANLLAHIDDPSHPDPDLPPDS